MIAEWPDVSLWEAVDAVRRRKCRRRRLAFITLVVLTAYIIVGLSLNGALSRMIEIPALILAALFACSIIWSST